MSENQPLVSVIMPNYNGEQFLSAAVQSVVNQTYQNWELLIIDDGSTDGSVEIARKWAAQDRRIRPLKNIFKKLAHGPGAARNTGIQEAKGRYIAFLDSDDLWLPQKLSEQVAFMQRDKIPFSFTWYEVITETGAKVGERRPDCHSVTYRQLLRDCVIGCLTAMYDTESLGKQLNNLHPKDRFGDGTLWLKLLKITPYAHCLRKPLAQYRLVAGSVSSNKMDAAKHYWGLLREIEGLSLLPALYYFTWYAFKGIFTKLTYIFRRQSDGPLMVSGKANQ